MSCAGCRGLAEQQGRRNDKSIAYCLTCGHQTRSTLELHDSALEGKLVCASCHKDDVKQFEMTFLEPDPHAVKMVQKRADFDSTLAEGTVAIAAVMPVQDRDSAGTRSQRW